MRLGAIGDVVRTLPAVSALRRAYPRARITWLVEPASASLLADQPWIDDVLVFPRPTLLALLGRGRLLALARTLREFVSRLRGLRPELVVDFHSILRSAMLARLSGAPRRVAYARPFGREGSTWLATDLARVGPRRIPRFERNAALLEYLGVEDRPAPAPLRLSPAAVAAFAHATGEPAPAVIHPGTSDATVHKRWTVAGYAAVARGLARETGTPVLVTAGPARDDRAFARAIVDAAGGSARPAPETPSLGHLAALFARCCLYVGSDTGPLHVASLVGTPVVQLLGPTHPVENEPWSGTPWRRVHVPVACSPCGRRGCAAATCMRVIPPDSVLDAARSLLAAPGSQ